MRLIAEANIAENYEAVRIVTFADIPQIYRDLYVMGVTRDGRNTTSGLHVWSMNNTYPSFQDNDLTNHHYRRFYGSSSGVGTDTGSDGYFFRRNSIRNYEQASKYESHIIHIPNYTDTSMYKNALNMSAAFTSESTPTRQDLTFEYDVLSSTSAVTNINISTEQSGAFFYEYSAVYLYGIPKYDDNNKMSPKAIGGQRVGTDGVYWYHGFISTGTFTPLSGLDCDVVVIAGGGSGGTSHGGGGGAGGVVFTPKVRVSMPVTVTVGAGGSGAGSSRNNGVDSSFGSITATGGGKGGVRNSATSAGSGGSGGGGGGSDGNTDTQGSGTAGQGTRGGIHTNTSYTGVSAGGAGGGGAGGFGENGQYSDATPGIGGYGTNAFDNWGRVLQTGYENTTAPLDSALMFKVFAGGGGGASSYSSGLTGRQSTGRDGGGDGNNSSASSTPNSGNGYPGQPATGSGGGGSWNNDAGSGGGGIVMVRYPV